MVCIPTHTIGAKQLRWLARGVQSPVRVQEWRHAHGMRCLKIPNTRHFHEITLIEDALSLWEKIKSTAGDHQWRPEVEEEYEDSQVSQRCSPDRLAATWRLPLCC